MPCLKFDDPFFSRPAIMGHCGRPITDLSGQPQGLNLFSIEWDMIIYGGYVRVSFFA